MQTLRDFRKSRGITQKWVADQLGVTAANLSCIESGKNHLTFDLASKLAKIFQIPLEKLFLLYSETHKHSA